jgi:hypothetical protein
MSSFLPQNGTKLHSGDYFALFSLGQAIEVIAIIQKHGTSFDRSPLKSDHAHPTQLSHSENRRTLPGFQMDAMGCEWPCGRK